MKCALRVGALALVLGLSLAGCQLGEKVDKPNLEPNTFIEAGFPEENQTWLSDAASFRFFGADPDNEIIAYYTRMEPALFTWNDPDAGVLDTLWPGEPAYSEGQVVFVDTLWFSDLGCWDPIANTVTCETEIYTARDASGADSNLVSPDSVISFYEWERTENQTRNYQGLRDAYYRFAVKSVDEGDVVDPAPATRHFLVLAATWPEIVTDRCPPRRDASPVERITFHGELGSLEPWQFLYSWALSSDLDECELCHAWTEWQTGATEVSYAGLEPGATYTFQVRSAIERAGVQIESRSLAECVFTVRTK